MAVVCVNGVKLEKAELLRKLREGSVPDEEVREIMREQIERRAQWCYEGKHEHQISRNVDLVKSLRKMNIAEEADNLDSQMYEVPLPFLQIMFGPRVKGSCCYFENESATLDEAEEAMLRLYCKRSQIRDGHRVLDLGCGQGAVTLYIAETYKNCHVTAITNSKSQKDFIEEQCRSKKLSNVEVLLEDIATLKMEATFDRILVIELLEHMKNYYLLLKKISEWLSKDGLLFIEHVCHRTLAYQYQPIDEEDWFTEYIFPDGTMLIPSATFLLYFQDDVSFVDHWTLSGKHYSLTNDRWLKRVDDNLDRVKKIMESSVGDKDEAAKLVNYWRGFCISGSELFRFVDGEDWMITHILLSKRSV